MTTKNTIDLPYLRNIKALVWLQGREYLTHGGLLRVAHENGLTGIGTELVSWDSKARAAVVKATATGERGIYTGYGDASPSNVGKNIAGATLRMAETRAVNRALRLYTGLGMTTTEELPGDVKEPAKALPSALQDPVTVGEPTEGCSACGKLISKKQANDSKAAVDVPLCREHQVIWTSDPDPSYTDEVERELIADLNAVGCSLRSIELRCMASPNWGKLPMHMSQDERDKLLKVMQDHHKKKNGST